MSQMNSDTTMDQFDDEFDASALVRPVKRFYWFDCCDCTGERGLWLLLVFLHPT